jgi:hypothetical protein
MDQGVLIAIIAGVFGIVGAVIGAWGAIAAARVKARHADVIRPGEPAKIGQSIIGRPDYQHYLPRNSAFPPVGG